MNRCRRIGIPLLLIGLLGLTPVLGQTLPGGGSGGGSAGGAIAVGVKSKAVLEAADTAAISSFIAAQMQRMQNGGESEAREALAREVKAGAGKASAAYLDEYSDQLNRALTGGPLGNASLRVRLNAAIAAARVAEESRSARLAPAAQAVLADPVPAVALWGVKLARAILPDALRLGRGQELLQKVTAAVAAQPTGPMAREAYSALALEDNLDAKVLSGGPWSELLKLFSVRLGLYAQSLPDDPNAEELPTLFLSRTSVWDRMAPAQQVQTVQLMSDLLSVAGQHFQKSQAGQPREPLSGLITQTAKALYVIAERIPGGGGLRDALVPLHRVGRDTPPEQVAGAVGQILAQLRKVPGYDGVKDPPALQAAK